MKWMLIVVVALHGLLHLLGPAKAFGWADLEALSTPISKAAGLVWALAGLLVLASAALWSFRVAGWWWVALAAVVVSQAVIVGAWSDARFGTVPNVLLLLAAVYGFASGGWLSLRTEYFAETRSRLAQVAEPAVLDEAALEGLPSLVAGYVRRSGAVGRPRVTHFSVGWEGRIRRLPGDPWMTFEAEQVNTIEPPSRFFVMDARRSGLPVDVLHAFREGEASMRVRLLSMFPMAHAKGPEMTRAETVTLFNDVVLFAPGALVSDRIRWVAVDDRTVEGHYTLGPNTVSARLLFDDEGELIDFVSDDRLAASADGESFEVMRWSTPVGEWVERDGVRGLRRGEARWHPADGEDYAYIEAEITDHRLNGPPP